MIQQIDERVTVVAVFYGKDMPIRPLKMRWGKRDYELGKVDFYNPSKDGLYLVHHFSLCDEEQQTYFKLAFHSGTLIWTLEELEDV